MIKLDFIAGIIVDSDFIKKFLIFICMTIVVSFFDEDFSILNICNYYTLSFFG